ncbi:MAG: hypothetical protein JRH01_22615 [Deltaproteobacteria bacterium]|nr:hypothetical protein [Deltaproteobacteria bacterium]MBW2392941.1 hypothetical protein [Deltaproteobacteria bacterium]
MQDRPTSAELLETLADLLEEQLLPATQGPLRHQVRVAGNLCRILEREARLGGPQDDREAELLRDVLGPVAEGSDTLELNRRLAEALKRGQDPALERKAWQALIEIVRGKLSIAKPGHDAYDFQGELPE